MGVLQMESGRTVEKGRGPGLAVGVQEQRAGTWRRHEYRRPHARDARARLHLAVFRKGIGAKLLAAGCRHDETGRGAGDGDALR